MTIAKRLADIISDKRIVKKELAAEIGVAQSTLQTWLGRGEDFPAQYVMPLCRALEVSPEYLLEGVEVPLPEIPEEYIKVTDDERFLLESFRSLDREGMVVVTNEAIKESRRSRTAQGGGSSNGRVG